MAGVIGTDSHGRILRKLLGDARIDTTLAFADDSRPTTAKQRVLGRDADLETALNTALESQRYLIAVWRLSDGRIHLYRELAGLPREDLRLAQELLDRDLATIAEKCEV